MEPIADRLAAQVREVYLQNDAPAYLDDGAAALLVEGRKAFAALGLGATPFLESGDDTHVLTWRGTAANSVLGVSLMAAGMECEIHDLGVTVADVSPGDLKALLARTKAPVAALELSAFVANLQQAKYDEYAPPDLLRRLWARANAELCADLPRMAQDLLNSEPC